MNTTRCFFGGQRERRNQKKKKKNKTNKKKNVDNGGQNKNHTKFTKPTMPRFYINCQTSLHDYFIFCTILFFLELIFSLEVKECFLSFFFQKIK